MADDDLFTTFVAAAPEQLIRSVEELLLLPWNTGTSRTLDFHGHDHE